MSCHLSKLSFAAPLVCFDVNYVGNMDEYNSEASWSITPGTCSAGPDVFGEYQDHSQQCCLTAGTYTLNCMDKYDDGWDYAYIEIKGSNYCVDWNNERCKTDGSNCNLKSNQLIV